MTTPLLRLAAFATALAAPSLALACPWAGGSYEFREHGIYGDFTVNGDCTQMTWSRLTDEPETTAMERTKAGWKGALSKGEVELLENGHNLRLTGFGGAMRQTKAERTN